MSSIHFTPPPQPAYLTDQSFQSSNSIAGRPPSIHPLQRPLQSLPEFQLHQQQQQQQYHYIQPQPTFHDAQDQEKEAPKIVHITSVNRSVEMTIHGIQAFVSLYAVSSIISAIRFQAAHNFTSLTALFLLLVALERQHNRQNSDILISMPEDEEHAQAPSERDLRTSEMSEVRAGNGSTVTPVSHPQSYQNLSDLRQHDQEQQPSNRGSQHITEKDIQKAFRHIAIGAEDIPDPDPNSLGLGIDLHKQFNLDSTEVATGYQYIRRTGSISGSSISHGSIAPSEVTSSDGPERSRSERLRDHAKIFPKVRSSAGSLHEPYSNRNTPLLYSRELAQVSPALSPNISTPTTPLSRGEIGYMGHQTMKALHTVPRSASLGYMAAFNNMSAASVQASPVMGAAGFDFAGTPISARSQRTMSFAGSSCINFQGDAATAEQSMDEHLKSVRRRSFANEAGTGSMILNIGEPLSSSGPVNPPNEANSPPRSNFRMSFSSPNLSNFRRKSSLGLKSVLNSLVTSPVSDSVSDVSSDASSPTSILSGDTDSISISQQSNSSGGRGDGVSVSAQDLLQLEYGEIFATLQRSHSALTLTDLNSPLPMHPYSSPGSGAPSTISRPRSGSGSSAHTSRSTSSSKTCSSVSSSSTASTLTGPLPGEDKVRSASSGKLAGPPLSFMNRILVGGYHSHILTRGNKQQHQHNHLGNGPPHHPHRPRKGLLRRGGSSGNLCEVAYNDDAIKHFKTQGRGSCSGGSIPLSRKFPSHGDLTQYSWDYRKEVCH
ncbi:hypothetical protein BGZ93_000811 [Podila epicladia]|nr:hypothetical protein BGZ93_000811 [Podila epicladia]